MNFKCYNNNYWYERNEKFQGVNVSLGRYCNVDLSMEIKLCWLVFINLNFNDSLASSRAKFEVYALSELILKLSSRSDVKGETLPPSSN